MATWVLTQGTSTITFNSDPFWLMEATGVGSAPVRRLSQRGPLQDGVVDLGYRLEPRMITLSIMIVGTSKSATDGHRDTLAALLKPSSTPVVLKYTRDDAAVRQIDCYVVNQVDMPAQRGERIGFWQRVVVQLVAPNPLWYDPTAASASSAAAGAVAWQLADGQISSGQVAEAVASPTQGQNITAGNLGHVDWSLGLRTSSNLSGTQRAFHLFRDLSGVDNNIILFGVNYSDSSEDGYNWTVSVFPDTSTHNVIIVYTAATKNTKIYRDGTLIFDQNSTMRTIFDGTTGKKWRSSYSGSETWTAAITRAAIYSIALSSTQVAALNGTLTNGDTISGFTVSATLSGNVDEYPLLQLSGPITSAIITNGATGDVLDFTGYTVADGTTLYIDLRYGYKTVVDSAGINRIDKLTGDSDLSTWRLAPGTNSISMSGSSTSANTVLRITYTHRYLHL